MNFSFQMAAPQVLCYVNDNAASIDQHWVMTTLMFLRNNTVATSLVKRDFEEIIQSHGDVINVRRPSNFDMDRTADNVNLNTQSAISTKIQVPLDQWATVSFLINDGERSKSFANLVEEYLEPAAIALAQAVDRIVLGQVARLLTYTAGELGGMTAANAQQFLIDTNKVLNDNAVPAAGRNLILSTNAEAKLLASSVVVEADKRGDAGTALRDASVGRIYNMQTWMDQNVNSVDTVDLETTGFTSGATVFAKGFAGEVTTTATTAGQNVGEYVTIDGEGYPHEAATLSATGVTLVDPLKKAIAASVDVTFYDAQTVKTSTLAGHYDFLELTMTSGILMQVGQLLAIGTGASREVYSVIRVSNVSATEQHVMLDRPIVSATTGASTLVFPGPAGDMNVAMHRDAVALVVRPLATAPDGEGAKSFVASFGGLSIRMTSSYDGLAQATRITLDMLCGVQILNEKLACLLLS